MLLFYEMCKMTVKTPTDSITNLSAKLAVYMYIYLCSKLNIMKDISDDSLLFSLTFPLIQGQCGVVMAVIIWRWLRKVIRIPQAVKTWMLQS